MTSASAMTASTAPARAGRGRRAVLHHDMGQCEGVFTKQAVVDLAPHEPAFPCG